MCAIRTARSRWTVSWMRPHWREPDGGGSRRVAGTLGAGAVGGSTWNKRGRLLTSAYVDAERVSAPRAGFSMISTSFACPITSTSHRPMKSPVWKMPTIALRSAANRAGSGHRREAAIDDPVAAVRLVRGVVSIQP